MAGQGGLSDDARGRVRTLNSLRVVFSVAGVGLIILGLFTMRETSRSRGWVKVDGRVVTSSVNEFRGKGGATYRPLVMYSYSVGPVRFMSNRIAFHPVSSGDRRAAATLAAGYPVGRTVQVFYDPQDPEQAVLDRGNNPWVPIVAGGAFSMLAVWMRILRGRIEKRGRNASA
jgi:hypothetical protein